MSPPFKAPFTALRRESFSAPAGNKVRSVRRVNRFLLLGAGLSLFVAASLASAVPVGASPPPRLTLVLDSGDTLHVVRVEPAGIGTVRITNDEGRFQFLSAHRIRRVLDEDGRDRTREALDLRRGIGSAPRAISLEPMPQEPRRARYGPRSVTRSFMITETSAFGRLDPSLDDERSFTASFDLGHAVNVTARDAVGASLFIGGGDGSGDFGVRARYRRWFGTRSCLEFAPGLILSHDEPGPADGRGIGFVGQIAYTYARWVSGALQIYSVRRSGVWQYVPGPDFFTPGYSYLEPGYRDTGVMLGVKIGGRAGMAAGAAGTLAAIVASSHRRFNPTYETIAPRLSPPAP